MSMSNGVSHGAVSLILALPDHVSQEKRAEQLQSTPEDFTTLPPMIVYHAEEVTVTFTPHVEGFGSSEPTKGSLHVLDSALTFMSASGSSGFQIPYPAITLHAVSRGDAGPSIYCQLDDTYSPNSVNGVTGQEDETDSEMRELVIVPSDSTTLESIFEALSHCAALHPDPAGPDDLDGDDDAFISTEADFDEQELSEAGRVAMEYLNSIIDNPFERPSISDAEEEETEPVEPVLSGQEKEHTDERLE